MSCECLTTKTETIKNKRGTCFACIGDCSVYPHVLKAGFCYESCSPLVQGPTKHDPWEPMTDPLQCIVAFVGLCDIDATDWEEDCKVPVYTDAKIIKQCMNLPKDADGNQLFTIEDVEGMAQAHTCCITFIDQVECAKAPAWVLEANAVKAKAVA